MLSFELNVGYYPAAYLLRKSKLMKIIFQTDHCHYSLIPTCEYLYQNIQANKMWNQKKECEQVADVFKTISHPERIAILSYICDCRNCTCRVKNIYENLNLSQPNVSRHLSLMKRQNIVKRISKDGDTYFTVNLENRIVRCIQSCLTEFKRT